MSRLRGIRHLWTGAVLIALLVLLAAAGCGGDEGGGNGNGNGGEEAAGTAIDAGLPPLEQIGPAETGAGEVPAFEWAAVDGAAQYRLVVLDGNGLILWSWIGSGTKVNLGGLKGERPAGVSGPVITPGSSWSVVAQDASGKTIATSNIRPVSP